MTSWKVEVVIEGPEETLLRQLYHVSWSNSLNELWLQEIVWSVIVLRHDFMAMEVVIKRLELMLLKTIRGSLLK